MTEQELLASFDYVITAKGQDNPYCVGMIERNKDILDMVFESNGYILFKVKHLLKWQEVLYKVYPDGIEVSASSSKSFVVRDLGKRVRLVLELATTQDDGALQQARFQINWIRSGTDRSAAGISMAPFDLKPGRNTYEHVFDAEPFAGMLGVVYLTSHDDRPVKAFSLRVWSADGPAALDKYLAEYSAKWPPLASILKDVR